ncbi:MAG: hypothetical protein V1859_06935 [archaeon]
MIELITAAYFGFGASFMAALTYFFARDKITAIKSGSALQIFDRKVLFEDMITKISEFTYYSEDFLDKKTIDSKKELDKSYVALTALEAIDYSSFKINEGYEKRIRAILALCNKAYVNLSNQKIYLVENKEILKSIKEKVWALTDKVRTEKIMFEQA